MLRPERYFPQAVESDPVRARFKPEPAILVSGCRVLTLPANLRTHYTERPPRRPAGVFVFVPRRDTR